MDILRRISIKMNKSPKHNLTYQLTHDLGNAIVSGSYKIDQGLPTEAQLCIEYKVSRSATREAIKMLSAKGLIISRPKTGILVLPQSNWDIFDTDVLSWILNSTPSLSLLKSFSEIRVTFEPQAAALAAVNATYKDIEDIEQALTNMEQAAEESTDALAAVIAFHTAILTASGNCFIVQLSDLISTAILVHDLQTKASTPKNDYIGKYINLLNAIKSRNPEKSSNAANRILESALLVY